MVLLLLLIPLLLAGCVYGPPLKSDEFGKAARCHWIYTTPYLCTYDPNRVTIDIDNLQEAIDTLEYYKREEFKRRKL